MAAEHFINLDAMHEYDWPKETEEEFRDMFHCQLAERRVCHIWRGQVFRMCQMCTNGDGYCEGGDYNDHKI